MKIRKITGLLALATLMVSCAKEKMSNVPELTFISLGWHDPALKDSIYLKYSYKDGDADMGMLGGPSLSHFDGYLKFLKADTPEFYGFYFEPIDESIRDPKKGMTGKGQFEFPNIYSPGDTLHFEMYIKDRAGNESNHIFTTEFIVN